MLRYCMKSNVTVSTGKSRLLLAILFMFILAMQPAVAQEQKHSVQLSGFVTAGDSLAGAEGAAVYVPERNQGVLTQQNGFFP